MRRGIVLAALVAGFLAAPADARQTPLKWKPPTVTGHLPAPGHITITLDRFTHKLGKGDKPPKAFSLHPKRAAKLPASVRVIYATRLIRTRKSVTLSVLQVAINAATKTPARAPARAGVTPAGQLELFIYYVWVAPENEEADREEWRRTIDRQWKQVHEAVVNADVAEPFTLNDLFRALRGDFTDDNQNVFELPANDDAAPAVGHYDDGHAFGWKPARVRDSFSDLTNSAAGRLAYEDLTRHIEEDLAADVDGDGDKGPPSCGQGNASTSVIQITSPGDQKVASYFMEMRVPFWDYWRHRGFAGGGCNFDDGSSQVNIDIYDGERLVAWEHDFPPYPTPPDSDQPAMGHGGETCTETFMTESGTPFTKNLCTVGHPTLAIPPPSEGFPGTGWPQDPATTPQYAIVFQVQGSEAGHTAFLKGNVSWRPKP